MTRRGWAGGLVVLIGGLAALWWTQKAPVYVLAQNADQNVLLITIDTLRADALGSYGGQAATPNLDALAAHGARFTFAHSHAVVTLPSHTSILTGRLPYEHGMRDNAGFRVKDGTETLATRLKPLGFATGAFVGGFPLTKRFGLTPGFDVYDDQISEMKSDVTFTLPERRADEVVGRAVEWIGRTPGKFFGWVHVFDAHSPYAPPAEFAGKYARPYDGEVAWIDQALGPLLTQLAALSRPTTVIVTADHGESLGEHGEETHGMFAYEATLRVPLIVATISPAGDTAGGKAAGVKKGLTIETPARLIDIAPTVLDIVSGPLDATWLGSSLRPVVSAGSGADRPSYFESMTYNLVRGWAPLRGVLQARTKYIDQPIPEIYDLAADPGEKINLAARQPDVLQVLTNLLRTFNVTAPNRPGQVSAEEAAKFGSLGYVSGAAPERHVFTEKDDLKNLVEIDRDLHRASELFRTGHHADGVALLRSVIERRPDTADAYISLAYAYWESGRWPDAIAALEAGLAGDAPERDIRIRLGIYLAESGTDVKRAIQLLEALPHSDAEGLNGLGLAYGSAGRFQDAIVAFQGVLKLDPTSALANQNIATMLLKEAGINAAAAKVREAEQFARRAIDLDPSLAKAFTTLGVIQAQTNRKSEAIDSWKKAVSLDPGEFDAMYNLVLLLVDAGRIGEARTYGQQYINTAPPQLAGDAAVIRQLLSR